MRIYTLEEARALLPEVRPVVRSMAEAYRKVRGLQAQVAAAARGVSADGNLITDPFTDAADDPTDRLVKAVEQAAARLDAWGIEVKDPERGLIDFYWEREGELVYLCWELGEDDIRFWHRIHDGYAGRRPL